MDSTLQGVISYLVQPVSDATTIRHYLRLVPNSSGKDKNLIIHSINRWHCHASTYEISVSQSTTHQTKLLNNSIYVKCLLIVRNTHIKCGKQPPVRNNSKQRRENN